MAAFAPRLPADLPLEHTAHLRTVPELKTLLASGSAGASEVNRALHAAVAQNDYALTKSLLQAGADPNRRLLGKPALFHAVSAGNVDIVGLLLAAGADPNASDTLGVPALVCSEDTGTTEVLLAAGANPNCQDWFGTTPLIRACRAGESRAPLVSSLLKYGAHLESSDPTGRTPLHEAAASGAAGLVALLLDANAPFAARDKSGATPIHVAAGASRCSPVYTNIITQLLGAGASASEASPVGTPVSVLLCAFFSSRVQRRHNAAECVAALGTLLAAGGTLMDGVEDAVRWLVVRAGLRDEASAASISDGELLDFLKQQSAIRPTRIP